MRLVTKTITRVATLAWLIAWVTTVPLFHTHLPETTSRLASNQTGLAHTVFSPDLPGEYSRFLNVSHQDHFTALSSLASNSAELGFTVLDDSKKLRKFLEQPLLALFFDFPRNPLLLISDLESRAIHPKTSLFGTPQGPRAPPSNNFA